jgi:perosamine synthetase
VSERTRKRIAAILDRGCFAEWYGGPVVREFESKFAELTGSAGAVAVNSGTSALHAAVAAAGISHGDEVIVPAAAYISAASVLVQQGAIPVIADIDPRTTTIDIEDIERRITERTRAVIPVHFWGCPSDMERLAALAARHALIVIEDCGQSHGATAGGRITGGIGDYGCYSFAPRKHITTGQGGMVVCRDAKACERVRALVNKGKGDGWLAYQELGFSYAMAEIEGALGLDGLEDLENEIARRRRAVETFTEALGGSGLQLPTDPPWGRHVYFKVPILLPTIDAGRRDAVVSAISAANVSCRPTHPPLYSIAWLAAYAADRARPFDPSTLPGAEELLPRAIEVESGPNLTPEDVRVSANIVLRVWNRFRSS